MLKDRAVNGRSHMLMVSLMASMKSKSLVRCTFLDGPASGTCIGTRAGGCAALSVNRHANLEFLFLNANLDFLFFASPCQLEIASLEMHRCPCVASAVLLPSQLG